MLGSNVLVRQAFSFFRGVGEHALTDMAQRQVDRGRGSRTNVAAPLDFFADGFYRGVRMQESIRQRLVLAQEAQQQMFRLDVSATELTGFVAGEEDDTTSCFRISLEHRASSSRRDSVVTPPSAESGPRLVRSRLIFKTSARTFPPRISPYTE